MTDSTSEAQSSRRLAWLLILLTVAIGLVGYYGPWVAHRAAGLIVIGLDLAEYVKFLPEVASGRIVVLREVFYLPLLAGSVTASLLASRRSLFGWLRWLLAFAAAPLALAMLPPAWSPGLLRLPEFRLQTLAIIICLLLLPGIAVTRRLPDWFVLAILAVLATLAAIGPTLAFLQVRESINLVFGRPPGIGWGFWINLLGFLAEAFLAIAEIIGPTRRQPPQRHG